MDSFGWGKTRKVITESEHEKLSQEKIDHHEVPQALAQAEAQSVSISLAKPQPAFIVTPRP
jgi:hypothetical protein